MIIGNSVQSMCRGNMIFEEAMSDGKNNFGWKDDSTNLGGTILGAKTIGGGK